MDVLDQWILVKVQELVNEVTGSLDSFDAFKSSRKIEDFINEFSTWYVRRSRERKGPAVYQTLYKVLKTLSLLLAPYVPVLAENIWQVLRQPQDPESVHLAPWPEEKQLTEKERSLLNSMDAVREAANLALSKRKELNIPIRQPLSRFAVKSDAELTPELKAILGSEINAKKFDETLLDKTSESIAVAEGHMVKQLALDMEITRELKLEGLARSIERLVQDMRKKTGLKVGESVILAYDTKDETLRQAMELFDRKKTYIERIEAKKADGQETFDVDGKSISLGLQK
jgi:isoleucyl-tRNA synthetase